MRRKTTYTNNFIPIAITPTNYAVTYTLYSYNESAFHIAMLGAELQTIQFLSTAT
jgi:hypothetical protein